MPKSFVTVREWVEKHSWPPEGGVRHLIHFAATNGFEVVVRRVGRRVLLDEEAFLAWIDAHREPPRQRAPRR